MSLESRGPRGVFLGLLGMLAAVHFDDQSMLQAAKIHNVIADRMLTAKLRTFQAPRTKLLPKQGLSFGLFAAQPADIGKHVV